MIELIVGNVSKVLIIFLRYCYMRQFFLQFATCNDVSCLTNRLRFSVRVYCNRSQMTSQRVKNKKVRDEVEWREKSFVEPVGMNGSNFKNETLFVSFTAIITTRNG